ncbi:SDR family oxidoreductase [Streptomyces sp. NPDC059224]|uniref:SDR family oxidoreductase n=1 Tax=Streptomyces sp. NPDC059224 TaxID=3346775 RepID=UPI00368A95C4
MRIPKLAKAGGIVAALTAVLIRHGADIVSLDQYSDNPQGGAFFQRTVLTLRGPLEDLGPAEIDRTLAVNVQGPYVASRAALRHTGQGGRLISIGSNVAERAVFPGLALYSMSKTALVGMTKGLARELGPPGINVNLVHPDPTDIDIDTDTDPADGPDAEAIAALTSLGRCAEASEIAATVAHLASADGSYVRRCLHPRRRRLHRLTREPDGLPDVPHSGACPPASVGPSSPISRPSRAAATATASGTAGCRRRR